MVQGLPVERGLVRILIAACLLALPILAHGQSAANKPAATAQPALKTFVSPDHNFQFNYSDILMVCQKQGAGENSTWVPAKNCAAYHPVCDAETPESYNAIACLAYPKNKFTDTDAFEAATFSVEILSGSTAESCRAKPADGLFEARDPILIHGVSFAAFEFGEGGMNQAVSGTMYRTFHAGKCYQLGINVATANADVFDPPAREMSKSDWNEVNGRLEQARDSFEFLK